MLIADAEKKLQTLMSKLKDECENEGLRISVDKTNTKGKEKVKVMIKVGDTEVKQVKSFVLLGSTITNQINSEGIVERTGFAKKTFSDMDEFFNNLSMNVKVRVRIMKRSVWVKVVI